VIAHLRGQIVSKTPNAVVVECGGVGYELAISVATYTELGEVGSEARVHVHTHVREDALLLFGFAEMAEKRLFEKLLTISGIGPKLAITVLSGISAERLVGAIRAGDHATLTKIPGIGKKTAERVVLELKDKLDDMAGFTVEAGVPVPISLGAVADDVLSALVNLGYPRAVAQKAVEAAYNEHASWKFAALGAMGAQTSAFEFYFRAAMAAVR
jgi:Holliday junction DNA helicase RuvA